MKNQLAYERYYKKQFRSIMLEQQKEVINNLEAKGASLTKDFDEKLFDDSNADKEMQKQLMPVLETLVVEQGALALVFAGDESSEFTVTQLLLALLRRSTEKMAQNFNDETLEKLNETLAQGIAGGESLGKLKKRVAEVYAGAKGYRALRVARYETLKASNNATNIAYKQTGYVKGKKWYANPGHCPICGAVDGEVVGLDTEFVPLGGSVEYVDENGKTQSRQATYDNINNPPLHPNCRCTIVPTRSVAPDAEPINSDEKDTSGIKAYHGEGHNLSNGNYALGDAYYASRDYSSAATFGDVEDVNLALSEKDILKITTDEEYSEFVRRALMYGLENDIKDYNDAAPAYVRSLGYRAAEIVPDLDPLGGIAVFDKKSIPK